MWSAQNSSLLREKTRASSVLRGRLRCQSRLTVTIRIRNRTPSALLINRHGVAAALPDVVIACRFLERQSEVGDLVLVPKGDLAGVSPDLVDQDPNAGLSRAGERNAHGEGGGKLHVACIDSCEVVR